MWIFPLSVCLSLFLSLSYYRSLSLSLALSPIRWAKRPAIQEPAESGCVLRDVRENKKTGVEGAGRRAHGVRLGPSRAPAVLP